MWTVDTDIQLLIVASLLPAYVKQMHDSFLLLGVCCSQWLNYSKVDGGTLNSGVNVELVPVLKSAGTDRNAD